MGPSLCRLAAMALLVAVAGKRRAFRYIFRSLYALTLAQRPAAARRELARRLQSVWRAATRFPSAHLPLSARAGASAARRAACPTSPPPLPLPPPLPPAAAATESACPSGKNYYLRLVGRDDCKEHGEAASGGAGHVSGCAPPAVGSGGGGAPNCPPPTAAPAAECRLVPSRSSLTASPCLQPQPAPTRRLPGRPPLLRPRPRPAPADAARRAHAVARGPGPPPGPRRRRLPAGQAPGAGGRRPQRNLRARPLVRRPPRRLLRRQPRPRWRGGGARLGLGARAWPPRPLPPRRPGGCWGAMVGTGVPGAPVPRASDGGGAPRPPASEPSPPPLLALAPTTNPPECRAVPPAAAARATWAPPAPAPPATPTPTPPPAPRAWACTRATTARPPPPGSWSPPPRCTSEWHGCLRWVGGRAGRSLVSSGGSSAAAAAGSCPPASRCSPLACCHHPPAPERRECGAPTFGPSPVQAIPGPSGTRAVRVTWRQPAGCKPAAYQVTAAAPSGPSVTLTTTRVRQRLGPGAVLGGCEARALVQRLALARHCKGLPAAAPAQLHACTLAARHLGATRAPSHWLPSLPPPARSTPSRCRR